MVNYLITPRTDLPLTLAGVQDFIQQPEVTEIPLITKLIEAATDYSEELMARTLMTTVFEQRFHCWPLCNVVEIRKNPVISITSVKYIDADGATQTVNSSNYSVWRRHGDVTVISFNDGYTVPTTKEIPEAWLIRYTAGYNPPDTIPGPIKSSMLMRIKRWYDNRDDGPGDKWHSIADQILQPYKIYL